MSRLWVLPVLVLIAVVAFVTACSSDEEQQVATPTSAISTSTTSSPKPSTTTIGTPTPSVTVPADWPMYSDPDGRFAIRYPANWFKGQASDFSNDPSMFETEQSLPPEVIKVEVIYSTSIGSDTCGHAKDGPGHGSIAGSTSRHNICIFGWRRGCENYSRGG